MGVRTTDPPLVASQGSNKTSPWAFLNTPFVRLRLRSVSQAPLKRGHSRPTALEAASGTMLSVGHYWDTWNGSSYTTGPILGAQCAYDPGRHLSPLERGL